MHCSYTTLVKRFTIGLLFLVFTFLCQTVVHAADVTLAWDPNSPTPDGYQLFQRFENSTYDYQSPVWSGTTPTCTISGLQADTTYYFVVRAFQGTLESGDSNEISYHTAAAPPPDHTITASAQTGGSITPSGSVTVVDGGSRIFDINADAHHVIADVRVDDQPVGAVGTYTLNNVTADHTIAASFNPRSYVIDASAGIHGTISPSGAVTVDDGASQTFTITAEPGYRIAQVDVDGQSVGKVAGYTFSQIEAGHTISVSFSAMQHVITAGAGQGGSITPQGTVAVDQGGTQSFTISPQVGYRIEDVLVDGVSVGSIGSYTFQNVQADHTIAAGFSLSNQAPVADAGPDQSVKENAVVHLSGTNSFDMDDGIASFAWRQVGGPSVSLSGQDDAEATFTAPSTGPDGLSLVFELQVTDYAGNTAADTCIVNVVWVNAPPTAQAGADQIAAEGQAVTLDGSNSVDPDQNITTYHWQQISGPAVQLSDANAVAPTFTCPDVGLQGASLEFQLTVGDSGGLQDTDSMIVTVTWINAPPVVDAGPDQQLIEGAECVLNGSNSRDDDDGITSYQWTQTDGPPVLLSDATAVSPVFTTPSVGPDGVTLTFQLTVTDKGGLQQQDSCHVNVLWQNMAPQASAGADQTIPAGALVKLDASGSSDPDDGIAAFQWAQTAGPSVVLSNPQAEAPTFTAPTVGMDGAALSFTLTVVDNGGLKAEDSCVVNVIWQNQPPVSQAGPDSQVNAGNTATLDGSGSHDSDDGIATYRWKQVSGPPVALDDPSAQTTHFQAPAVEVKTSMVFELDVTDEGGLQSSDTCSIVVVPVAIETDNTPPEIRVADPGKNNIWVIGNKITIRGTAWDNRQVDRVEWASDRGYSGVATGTESWEIMDLPLKRKRNTITLTAYDTGGNSSSVRLNIFAFTWWR